MNFFVSFNYMRACVPTGGQSQRVNESTCNNGGNYKSNLAGEKSSAGLSNSRHVVYIE